MVITASTADCKIWKSNIFVTDVALAMSKNENITVDLLFEGPCAHSLGLYGILERCANQHNYDLSSVVLLTSNKLETHPIIDIRYTEPLHLLDNAIKLYKDASINKTINKHFGSFIGKGNAPRLHINAYLHKHYLKKTIQLYRFNLADDYYRDNMGLEELLKKYNVGDVVMESKFIAECPILLENTYSMKYNETGAYTDNTLNSYYDNIFVDVVQESYYTGNTFFPSEKLWRPILLKTPFIVQGPQWYLTNLKKLGFKTFNKWWDEGYSEDPTAHSLTEIKTVLDVIASKDVGSLKTMYSDMDSVLTHNYNVLMELYDRF
jgi:hypothetical protein